MKTRCRFLIGWSLIAWGLAGCGGSGALRDYRALKVPPGISPLVAARADSIAAGLFVTMKNEREAGTLFEKGRQHYNVSDSLWLVLDNAKKASSKSVRADDSLAAVKQTIPGTLKLQEAAQNLQTFDRTQEQRLMIQASYNLKEAQKYLERSVQLNPFNAPVQNYLALTYKLLAQRFPKDMSFEKALHIWGTLARLEPGEYLHYYNLGSTYFAEQHWADALENFKKSEEVLLASAEVNPRRLQNPALPVEAEQHFKRLRHPHPLVNFREIRITVSPYVEQAFQSLFCHSRNGPRRKIFGRVQGKRNAAQEAVALHFYTRTGH